MNFPLDLNLKSRRIYFLQFFTMNRNFYTRETDEFAECSLSESDCVTITNRNVQTDHELYNRYQLLKKKKKEQEKIYGMTSKNNSG